MKRLLLAMLTVCLAAVLIGGRAAPGLAQPAPPGSTCLEHPNRPLIIARKPCSAGEGLPGTSVYLGSCCPGVCDARDAGQPQCPSFAVRGVSTAATQGCRLWAHELFGYTPLAACPQSRPAPRLAQPAPPESLCLEHPNRPLIIARKPCGAGEGLPGTSVYLGSCCAGACDRLDAGQPQCPLFAVRGASTAATQGCRYWAHENFGYTPLAACPHAPRGLRERVIANPGPGEPSYVLAGPNASVQYWKDGGDVTQGLYRSTDGSVSVRTFYDAATGLPRTILDEVSGNWLLIREHGPNSVDFWLYDRYGNYLGGFAVVEDDGAYSFGAIAGLPVLAGGPLTGTLRPAGSAWTGSFTLEDDTADVRDVQDVPPPIARFLDALSSDVRTAALPGAAAELLRRAAAFLTPANALAADSPYNVQNAARVVGLSLLAAGGVTALAAGTLAAAPGLLTAGVAALVVSAFVPDLADGVKARCNAGGQPSINPALTRNLCRLAANFLANDGKRRLLGTFRGVVGATSDEVQDKFAHGGRALSQAGDGLAPPRPATRDRDEPGSADTPPPMPSDLTGTARRSDGTQAALSGTMDKNGRYRAAGTDGDGNAVSVGGDQDDEGGTGGWGSERMTTEHTSRPIPNWEGVVEEVGRLDLDTHFPDPAPGRGAREYLFETATHGVADLVQVGSTLMWRAQREGATWVTVTAAYPGPIHIETREFLITVTADDPEPEPAARSIPSWEGPVGSRHHVSLSAYFLNPHPVHGDLKYYVDADNPQIAELKLVGDRLSWKAARQGSTRVYVRTAKPGPIVVESKQFRITVAAGSEAREPEAPAPGTSRPGAQCASIGRTITRSYRDRTCPAERPYRLSVCFPPPATNTGAECPNYRDEGCGEGSVYLEPDDVIPGLSTNVACP